jgi:hypothetical protein
MSVIKRNNDNYVIGQKESIALAFLLGPRRDGVILTKEGTCISTNEIHNNKEPLQQIAKQTSAQGPTDHGNQTWTRQLLLCQLTQPKMGYNRRTQKRAKLMRQIRQHVQRQPTATALAKGDIQYEVTYTPHQRLNQVPVITQGKDYPATMGQVLHQFMNAIRSPNRPKINKRVQVTLRTRTTVKRTRKFSSIKIPGTPPEQIEEVEGTDSELEDINLFFSISNRFRPEMGESNAESAARHAEIDEEYQRLRRQRPKKKAQTTNKQEKGHALSPFKPIQGKVKFRIAEKHEPIFEPIETHTNNVQEVQMDSDHYLYDNPDKPPAPQVLDLIYDTGASISMMPAAYNYAWKNLRDCLHTLTGCFAGQEESNLKIGEFHGIITLDSGEKRRVIIPECVQTPIGVSNTNLLADTAFLMAGHKYISHLSAPKLKFEGGGTYTMSVTRGHKIIKILPTHANVETPHKTIYLHLDELYDPPTLVNNALYQCTNRPNAQTPSAFTWHLRYGCKCASVLKHTQHQVERTFNDLSKLLLPCSACLAGKARKAKKQPVKNFTDTANLATTVTNAPLSWTPTTEHKVVEPNQTVSLNWGIINKTSKSGTHNVFALFLDINTGLKVEDKQATLYKPT